MCGTSEGSATFAGSLGFPFAFHDFLSPQKRSEDRIAVCKKYFEAGGEKLAVAVSGICAESPAEAERLWMSSFRDRDLRRPSFLGTPAECAAQIDQIADRMGADEIVIQPLLYDFDRRLSIFENLIEPLRTMRPEAAP